MRRDHLLRSVVVGALIAFPLAATGLGSARAAVAPSPTDVAPAAAAIAHSDDASGGRFVNPINIDARYFPLKPGRQFTYDGTVTDADGTHQHRVIFTVSDVLKVINGVRTRVIWDQDINDGVLTEAELAFFAQDDHSNVWTLGEYPEEYEAGQFVGAPSTWISGVARAQGGILVPGQPRVGTPPFIQGKAPAIDFFDVGQVIREGVRICVPAGCFSNVVVIDESSPTAPENGHQQKYYAPNVGLVNITANSGNAPEVLGLSSVRTLSSSALASASAQVLRLDGRAYRFAPVYRGTPPAYRER